MGIARRACGLVAVVFVLSVAAQPAQAQQRAQEIEIIQNVHFVFRPPSSGETDISLLYADASPPVVQQVMTEQGVPNPENLEAFSLFRDELSFASLSLDQGADIVAVAGSPIRGEFDRRRKAVLQRFKRFIYDRDKVYITEVR